MKKTLHFLFLFCFFYYSGWSQCLQEVSDLSPLGALDTSSDFGKSIAISGDYMAVAETTNDSLASNSGIIYVFKSQPDGSWEKIATLAASDPIQNFYLGYHLAFDGNVIVAASSGSRQTRVYVFTKEEETEWVNSTESYSFEVREIIDNKPFVIKSLATSQNHIAVSHTYSYTFSDDYELQTNVYELNNTDPVATIPSVAIPEGYFFEIGPIKFGEDFLAISYPYYRGEEIGSNVGIVCIYENDAETGWNTTPNAKLSPSLTAQLHFGIDIEIENDVVFAANSYGRENNLYESQIFGFIKPESGWTDSNESFILSTGITNSSANDAEITVNSEYLIHSKWYENQISIFKKNVEWVDQESDLTFDLPDDDYYTNPSLGANHLVINARSNPHAISYYRSSGDLENLTSEYDIVEDPTSSAANFQFGHSTAIYQDKMVVGAPRDGTDGAVYYYEKMDGHWELQSKIESPIEGDYFGYYVELYENDLFVSVPFADSLNTDGSFYLSSMGKVLHYQLSESNWELLTEIKSPDLVDNLNDKRHFGKSISYNNGHVAIGRYYTGSSETDGRVFIYKRNGNDWDHVATMQPEIDSRGDFFGNNIKLTNELLIVGARNYGGIHVTKNSPTVFIYNKTDEWSSSTEDAKLVASDATTFTYFGSSLDINESTIVVGAPNADQTSSYSNAGQAYIFERPQNGWYGEINEQLILKPSTRTEGSEFGRSVLITDTELLVGGSFHEEGEIFKFDRSLNTSNSVLNETEILSSSNPSPSGEFGSNISSFDNQIAIAAPSNNSDEGFKSGQIFTYQSNSTFTRDEATNCDSYEWQGDVLTESGLYIKKLVGNNGCDSLKYLDLIILKSTEGSKDITACDSYEWEGTTFTESGEYTSTFVNSVGCDSTATLNLTINYSNEGSSTIAACDYYNWRGTTLTESGIYQRTLVNSFGCDSIATLDLTILEDSEGSLDVEACAPYEWQGFLYSSSGTYSKMLTNQFGCDSLATLNLTILNNKGSNSVTACNSYSWQGQTYTESGVYAEILTNVHGCDSVAFLYLTITDQVEGSAFVESCAPYLWQGQEYVNSGSYQTNLTSADGCDSLATLHLTILDNEGYAEITACESYDWEGSTYSQSGQYSTILTNANGCDSTATLSLSIQQMREIELSFADNIITYSSAEENLQYQWYDCDTQQPIEDADMPELSISESGSFYLEIDDGVCVSTSECVEFEYVLSIPDTDERIYPNPTDGIIKIDIYSGFEKLILSNINGKTMPVRLNNMQIDLSSFPSGIYFLTIYVENKINTIKILKK